MNSYRNPATRYTVKKIWALAGTLFTFVSAVAQPTYTNAIGMKFQQIPGNVVFSMGKVTTDPNGVFWDGAPVHQVRISHAYYLGVTEVTNAQYELFQTSHVRGTNRAVSGDTQPAVNVSWTQAEAFVAWLNHNYPSTQPGMFYRLPTEAEWEYAADNASNFSLGMMQSGAEEWTGDWYGPYTSKAQTDPVGPAKGVFRVSRGNDYNAYPGYSDPTVRMGSLPWDVNPCIGFRVALGPTLTPNPLGEASNSPERAVADIKPLWTENVSQKACSFQPPVPSTKPYFSTPEQYFTLPSPLQGPFYSHDHEPAITYCPNGDLFVAFFSCVSETGREMTVLASRLRQGASAWDAPSLFYHTPSRNETGVGLFNDNGTLYHFQGFAADGGYDNLANCFQTSTDNGMTWSTPRMINSTHGYRNQVISGFRTANRRLIVPCDATPNNGGGTAIHYSDDNGVTWADPGVGLSTPGFVQGGTGHMIAGIHAAVTETIRNGAHVLIAYGRQDNINGMMPQSLSTDNGITWTYSASPFPAISGGQRAICKQLSSGALLLVSFAPSGTAFTNKGGQSYNGSGLFAALSYDGGQTWPLMKLVTDGATRTLQGYGNTGTFTTGLYNTEPAGYLAGVQTPDGIIHVISSGVYYSFNQSWLETPYAAPPGATTVTIKNGSFASPTMAAGLSQVVVPTGWAIMGTAGILNTTQMADHSIDASPDPDPSGQCAFMSTIANGTSVNSVSQALTDAKSHPVNVAAGQTFQLQFYIARRKLATTSENITTGSGAMLTYGIRDAVTKRVIASGTFDTDTIAQAVWTKITAVLRTGSAPLSGDQAELFFSKNVGGQVLIDGVTMAPDFSPPAADLVTGAIPLNPTAASVAEQNNLISQLRAAGVHVIRVALTTDNVRIDFARRAYDQGIKIEALIEPQFPKGALDGSDQSDGPPKIWGGLPLASIDPVLSKTYFQTLFQKLEANGIVLAGLELGNEINWTNVNKDFPNTIHGKIFNFDDLHHDPQAQQVAAGLLQYLKILGVLKDVRDHSSLNQTTPIISAGLSTVGPAGTTPDFFTLHGYAVTISATLTFLRAGGLDNLVDAYGIHYYPNDKTTAAERRKRMDTYAVSQCRPAGVAGGKPCWITEWGFNNNDKSCPVNDSARARLIQETMNDFRDLARQGRLRSIFFYSWNSPPGSNQISPSSIYRCGALTNAGKLTLEH